MPVHLGLISGDQLIAIADLAESCGGDIRLTRQQNFILAGVPTSRTRSASRTRWRAIGFPLDANRVRGQRDRLHRRAALQLLGRRDEDAARPPRRRGSRRASANDIADLRLHLDGCPHACAQHWIGDLGLQGTTARDEDGARRQAYDIFVRGGLGAGAAIGRPLFRRVPTDELDAAVERLVDGWLDRRRLPGESFSAVRPAVERRRPWRPGRPRAGPATTT